jgi:hypothetical protein
VTAAPPQQELNGQHAVASFTCSTRRAASPYLSRTTCVSASDPLSVTDMIASLIKNG